MSHCTGVNGGVLEEPPRASFYLCLGQFLRMVYYVIFVFVSLMNTSVSVYVSYRCALDHT